MKKEIKIIIVSVIIIILAAIAAIFIISKKENTNTSINNSNYTHIVDTIEDSKGTTFAKIDADVIGSDTDSFSTTELVAFDFTVEDAKNYANILFDNSDYTYQRLFYGHTESDCLNIIDCLNNEKKQAMNTPPETMSSEEYSDYLIGIDNSIQFYTTLIESNIKDDSLTENPLYLPEITDSPNIIDPNSTEVNKYCSFSGTYNNIPYNLTFVQHLVTLSTSITFEMESYNTPVWGDYTLNQVSYDYMSIQDNNISSSNNTNQCKYSKEDAIFLCNNMLSQLGITDMDVITTVNLETTINDQEDFIIQNILNKGTCGYYISYGKKINDKSINYSSYHVYGSYDTFAGDGCGTDNKCDINSLVRGQETLYFIVMDSGIISMTYNFPTVIDNISTATTPLLSFDVIMSVFDKEMQKEFGSTAFYKAPANNVVITTIKLGLARVTIDAKEGQYTLIPVWDFYTDDYNNVDITINAIDGSIIDSYTGYIKE